MSEEPVPYYPTITNDDVTKEAWDRYNELRGSVQKQTITYLQVGLNLQQIRNKKLYKYLGNGGFDSFLDFINNPEVGISQSSCYLYIGVYEFYIEKLELPETEVMTIPLNRLMRLKAPLKKMDKEKARQIIQDMAHLTNTDYYLEILDKKLESKRPKLYKDKETNKYILEFNPDQMLRILNKATNEILYENEETENVLTT